MADRRTSSRPLAGRAAARALIVTVITAAAFAAQAQPPPSGQPAPIVPPTRSTDLEIDPDAPPSPPPEEKPAEPPPLPEAPPGTWGVGGKEEEGRFAPGGKTGTLKEQEEAEREAAEEKKPVDLGPPGAVTVDTVIGFGKMRDVVADAFGAGDPASITAISLVFGLSYRFGQTWTVGARFPYSFATIDVPRADTAADAYNTGAVGNLELSVRPSFQLTRRLRLPVQLAFYFPTAPGDLLAGLSTEANVARAQALISQAAMSARGWEENPLLAYGRISLSPGVGLTYDRGPLHGAVSTRLDLMLRSGGTEVGAVEGQPVDSEVRDPAVTWLLGGSASYDFLDGKLSPGLRAWLAYSSQPLRAGEVDYSGAQFVVEPQVNSRIPLTGRFSLRAGAGFILPLGGHLGGADAASVMGARLLVGLLL